MKRWIGAVVVLVCAAGSAARADYVKFVYNPTAAAGTGAVKGGGPAVDTGGEAGEAPTGRRGGRGQQQQQDQKKKEDPTEFSALRVEVVVEVLHAKRAGLIREIKHKYGKKTLPLENTDDVTHEYITMKGTVRDRYKKEVEDSDKKTADDWRRLAESALKNRLLDEFVSDMKEMAAKDAKDPVVVAYTQVEQAIGRPLPDDPALGNLKSETFGDSTKVSDHYTIVYKNGKILPNEIDLWSDLLEQNYRAFYYWFALHGKVLAMPAHKLSIMVVAKKPEFMGEVRPAFDNQPTVTDGFFSVRDHVVVCCNQPLDPTYEALDRVLENLAAAGWKLDTLLDSFVKSAPVALFRTPAGQVQVLKGVYKVLIHKVMKEESRLRTITHLGTAQLVAESGLLPRGVEAPRWIQFGLASLFENGEGSLWPNTGLPNPLYLSKFQAWKQTDKADRQLDKSAEALRSVVTDAYFNGAHEEPEAMLKARTMTWSLTYFLAQSNLDGLLRYYQELGKLPRDMAFDEPILLACFARAFDLTDPGKPDEPNPSKLERLGYNWYAVIGDLTSPFASAESKAELKTQRKP